MLSTPISAQKSENTKSSIYKQTASTFTCLQLFHWVIQWFWAGSSQICFTLQYLVDLVSDRLHLCIFRLHDLQLHLDLRVQVWQFTLHTRNLLESRGETFSWWFLSAPVLVSHTHVVWRCVWESGGSVASPPDTSGCFSSGGFPAQFLSISDESEPPEPEQWSVWGLTPFVSASLSPVRRKNYSERKNSCATYTLIFRV